MFDIWKNLKDIVKVNYHHVYTTNAIFILHTKVTVLILVGLSILVTSRQYLGDPIDCISSPDIKNIADRLDNALFIIPLQLTYVKYKTYSQGTAGSIALLLVEDWMMRGNGDMKLVMLDIMFAF